MDRVKRIWYLSPMRAAKVQASLRIRAVSPEPSLLAHTSSESRGTFRQKTRSLAPLNGLACAVEICHDGMLEDTNSLDGAQIWNWLTFLRIAIMSQRICYGLDRIYVCLMHNLCSKGGSSRISSSGWRSSFCLHLSWKTKTKHNKTFFENVSFSKVLQILLLNRKV